MVDLGIGAKLRNARRARRLTLKALADKAGCSESLLSKIENDKVRPSLQTLHHLVSSLGITIASLFVRSDAEESVVQRRGKRFILNVGATGGRWAHGVSLECVVPTEAANLLNGSIHIIEPGGGSGGSIKHAGEEVGYVLEGRVELSVGGRSYELEQGDSFFFQSDLPHGYRNVGETEARILWINTPPTF